MSIPAHTMAKHAVHIMSISETAAHGMRCEAPKNDEQGSERCARRRQRDGVNIGNMALTLVGGGSGGEAGGTTA